MYDKAVNATGLSLMGVATVAQTNEVFQMVQIIITSVSALVVLAFNIWKWYKKAKADKKITDDEIDELEKIVTGSLKKEESDEDQKENK